MKQIFLALGIVAMGLPAWGNSAATSVINDVRASNGRAAITYSAKLEQAARAHANDMGRAGFFSHKGSNGSTVGKRVRRAGYRFCFAAENIAKGQRSLGAVMQAWVNSPGHYKNMMHRKVREFAVVRGEGNIWVMVLGSRC